MASVNPPEDNPNTLNLPVASPCHSSAATSVTSGPDSILDSSDSNDALYQIAPSEREPVSDRSPGDDISARIKQFLVDLTQSNPWRDETAQVVRSRSLSSSSVSSGGWTSSYGPSNVMSRSSSFPAQLSLEEVPQIDPDVIVDLEKHANRLGDRIYHMMALTKNSLYKMSGLTLSCTEAFSESVDLTCDSVDVSIKVMYSLMAKCEEISKEVSSALTLRQEINEIKRVLDQIEPVLLDNKI